MATSVSSFTEADDNSMPSAAQDSEQRSWPSKTWALGVLAHAQVKAAKNMRIFISSLKAENLFQYLKIYPLAQAKHHIQEPFL